MKYLVPFISTFLLIFISILLLNFVSRDAGFMFALSFTWPNAFFVHWWVTK